MKLYQDNEKKKKHYKFLSVWIYNFKFLPKHHEF